ncbi:MAG: Hsp20/alpha crystallin family protein [Methanotrichaceae archaeon]|nr:Hsp20/alpha crystallin family protein [Methanotrichaceae archaeon]
MVDRIDDGNQYVIRTELPGFSNDDADIELNKDTLVFKAEKKLAEEKKSQNYLHRERSYTPCQRTVYFPEEVEPSKVEGTMKNGIFSSRYRKKNLKLKKNE